MKTRQGFVSNSSTSSFVIIGYEVDENRFSMSDYATKLYGLDPSKLSEDELKDEYCDAKHNNDIIVVDCDDDGAPDGKHIIGFHMCHSNESGLDSDSCDLVEAIEKLKPVRDKFDLNGETVKVFTGTRCC